MEVTLKQGKNYLNGNLNEECKEYTKEEMIISFIKFLEELRNDDNLDVSIQLNIKPEESPSYYYKVIIDKK